MIHFDVNLQQNGWYCKEIFKRAFMVTHRESSIGNTFNLIHQITYVFTEADAASKAGCRVLLSLRPGNAPISEEDRSRFVCITSFDELIPNSAA